MSEPKERRDKRILLRARQRLLSRVLEDIDFWYDLAKQHAVTSERQHDPAVKMAMKMLDKVLAEQREREDQLPTAPAIAFQVLIGQGIERGTIEARALALQHQAERRISYGDAATEAEPSDNAGAVPPAESISDSVP